MSRPENVTNEDIARWNEIMEKDPVLESLPSELAQSAVLKEVCYAGIWFAEELEKLNCPIEIIVRIQYHAGRLAFGRDAWEVHQKILNDYKDNKLVFEADPNELLN